MKSGGWRGHTTSSASVASSATVSGGPTGTATTTCAGPAVRTAATAARIVAPVASPSSTSTTVTPVSAGRWPVAAQAGVALVELAPGDGDARGDVGVREPEAGDEAVVAHDEPTRGDRPDGQLDVAGRADLAHGEHVERGAEPRRDLGGDGDAAACQAEHDDRPGGHVGPRPRRRAR